MVTSEFHHAGNFLFFCEQSMRMSKNATQAERGFPVSGQGYIGKCLDKNQGKENRSSNNLPDSFSIV